MRLSVFRLYEPSRAAKISGVILLVWVVYLLSPGQLAFTDDGPQSPSSYGLCRRHGWKPFSQKPGNSPRKVYDLIMVNTELDWLEIRLNTTHDHVDYFVIVEGRRTFTGLDKPLAIRDNWERFGPYHSKLIYHELVYPPDFWPTRACDYEDFQRNAMYGQVLPVLPDDSRPLEGDVIVVADVDEVPKPSTLDTLRACVFPRRLTLNSRFHYYSFQFLHRNKPEWPHPQATYYDGQNTVLPVNLRNGDGGFQPRIWFDKATLHNASWHCSSCFDTVAEFLRKLESFSHMLLNEPRFRDRDRIVDRVRAGRDLWDRKGEEFDMIEANRDVPAFVLDNSKRFGYLVNRTGESAGFKDYA